jgi:hypothetical protein
LVHQSFLFEFLPLLGLVIVMQAGEGFLGVLLSRGLTLGCYSFRVEGALPQLYVIFEGLQTLQILPFCLGVLVQAVAKLILIIVIQVLSLY